ncbi:MAG: hypothetical protein ABIO92_06720 [Chloroflexia bacterium]
MEEENSRQSRGALMVLVAFSGMLLGAVLGFCGGLFVESFSPLSKSAEYLGEGGMVGCIIGAVVGSFIILIFIGMRYFGSRSAH